MAKSIIKKNLLLLLLFVLFITASNSMEPVEKSNEEGLLVAPEPLLIKQEKPKHTCIHDKIAASFKPVVAEEDNDGSTSHTQSAEHKTD
jgi:hypothetical protein